MAEYSARWDELQKGLKEAQEKEKPIPFDLKHLSVIDRYDRFKESLEDYVGWRDKALNDSFAILKNESTSITGSAQKDKWDDHFEKQSQEAFKMILGYVPDDEHTPELRLYAESVASQESAFFSKISSAPLAWCQGKVQEYTLQFYNEMNSLEDKWSRLENDDRTIDDKIQRTSKEVITLFEKIVKEIIDEERKVEDKIRNATPGLPTGPVSTIIEILKLGVVHIVNKAAELRKDLNEYVNDLMNLYKKEETIVILFDQTRTGVKEFLDKTNLDTATEEFEESCKNSLAMAGQCPTKAQQDDAKRFMEKGIGIVKDFFADFKSQYEEFISDTGGIFVGPVGDNAIEDLLEIKDAEQTWDQITRLDVQSKLKDLYNDALRAWEIDIDGLDDEKKRELESFWKGELEKLSRGLVAASEDTVFDRLKKYYESKKLLKGKVENSKGGLQ